MKKILFFVSLLLCTASFSFGQTKVRVYRTTNLNIGFGVSSQCVNPYVFCVNGPLVGVDNLPVGGYIDNGFQKQNWIDPVQGGGNFAVDNAIFGLGSDGAMRMVSYAERQMLPAMKWAFQNGPILVKNGKNIRGTSTSTFVRSGIGYTSTGTLVVIIALEPITFKDFAELFVQEHCVHAIYLDGGPYVGFADDVNNWGLVAPAIKLQFYNN